MRFLEALEQPLGREADLYARSVTFCDPVNLFVRRYAFRIGDGEQHACCIPVIAGGVLQKPQHESHVERIVLTGRERRLFYALETECRSLTFGGQMKRRRRRVVGGVDLEHGE